MLRLATGIGLVPMDMGIDAATFARQSMLFPCDDPKTGIRVDFVFSWLEFEQRAVARVIEGYPVKVATVGDVIVMKMISGRPEDIRDVQALYLRAKVLDLSYIRTWLRSFREMLADTYDERFDQLVETTKRKLGQ